MIKLEKYTGQKTYMYPNGGLATPESVLENFPAILTFTHVIETDTAGEVMYAVENLSAMRGRLGINSSLSEEDAIKALEELRNAPSPEPEVSAEERIAAALEFQNLLSL